jgi:hypothetical protein
VLLRRAGGFVSGVAAGGPHGRAILIDRNDFSFASHSFFELVSNFVRRLLRYAAGFKLQGKQNHGHHAQKRHGARLGRASEYCNRNQLRRSDPSKCRNRRRNDVARHTRAHNCGILGRPQVKASPAPQAASGRLFLWPRVSARRRCRFRWTTPGWNLW